MCSEAVSHFKLSGCVFFCTSFTSDIPRFFRWDGETKAMLDGDYAKAMLDGELFRLKNFWHENVASEKENDQTVYIVFEMSNVFNNLGFFKQKFPFPMKI